MIIDVSKWQGEINWRLVATQVEGAIVRAYNGTKEDETFVRNINGCLTCGIPVGVYYYSKAKTPGALKKELNAVDNIIRKYQDVITLGVFIDLEEKGTENQAGANAKEFISFMTEKGYKKVGVYANEGWYKTYLKGVDIPYKWVAKWTTKKTLPSIDSLYLHQYTSKGRVKGIDGDVDLSNLVTEVKPVTTKPVAVVKEDINLKIAKEVIQGKWGNGAERKNRLTQAGYNYRKVQAIVNTLARK